MCLAEYPEALRCFAEGTQTEIICSQLQIERHGFCPGCTGRELRFVAEKYGIELGLQKTVCSDIAVRLCCHIEGDCLHRRIRKPVRFHDLPVRSKADSSFCGIPDIQMIAVAFTADSRIRAENHIRLIIADCGKNDPEKIFLSVEGAV